MKIIPRALVVLALVIRPTIATSTETNFSGTWTIDLRTPAERISKAECGGATFTLKQTDDRIVGEHTFATVGCGRLNEGGEGTVKGVVVGSTAVLIVTSGRNGAVVFGVATIVGGRLKWDVLDEIKSGEPEGDSPLILQHGMLSREASSRSLNPKTFP
jgi:hypothetical protein